MTEGELLKTALHGKHVAAEAKMGSDGGWAMPLSFCGAMDEVDAIGLRAGVFDISNVGRIRVRGDEALDLVERLCTADVVRQEDDTARFTLLCNEGGGIIDQCLALRIDDWWLLTTSPVNRLKVLEHAKAVGQGLSVKIDDQTTKTTMVCVAGAQVEGMLDRSLPINVAGFKRGQVKTGTLMIARYIAVRTSYMGAWALEVILPNMFAGQAWRFITDKAGENAAPPAGVTARDVLRIRAGHCLYGHELNETIDPFTAGLGNAVSFDHDFIGREALEALASKTPARRRVGLEIDIPADQGGAPGTIPAMGTPVTRPDGGQVGTVTSGTLGRQADQVIAMAYLATDSAEAGREVLVGDRTPRPARVVSLPPAC